jgi:ABC-2 type transport system permease protein
VNIHLIMLHARTDLVQHLREPGYLIQVLVFPTMFYLFFGLPEATYSTTSNMTMASYAVYTFMSVAFIQFAGGIAQGRLQAWDEFVRTLPASYSHRMVGWSLSGLLIGVVALGFVTLAAVLTTDVRLGLVQWVFLAVAVLYGSLTMALIASACGYWLSPVVALPVGTLTYFALTYAGGIWTAPDELPAWLQHVSPFLPSRIWAELAWASVRREAWQAQHWLGLAGYAILGGSLAYWGYRRELDRRRRRAA